MPNNFTDDDIRRALERMYRLKRVVECGAPVELILLTEQLVDESRQLLGETKWAELEHRLKTYQYFLRARERQSDAAIDAALIKESE